MRDTLSKVVKRYSTVIFLTAAFLRWRRWRIQEEQALYAKGAFMGNDGWDWYTPRGSCLFFCFTLNFGYEVVFHFGGLGFFYCGHFASLTIA